MRYSRPLVASVLLCALVLACEPSAPEKKEKAAPVSGEAAPKGDKAAAEADVAIKEAPTEPLEEAAAPEEAAAAEVLADFAVHEWGMLRHTADQLFVSTTPPKRPPVGGFGKDQVKDPDWGELLGDEPGKANGQFGLGMSGVGAAGGKPLIMLHPGPTFDANTDISVSVSLVGGTFREVWPTPALGAQPEHASTYSWTGVRATAEPCGREMAPAADHIACTTIDAGGLCEAAEMAAYLSPVPNCLSVGDSKTPALVYNGLFPGAPAPLVLSEGEDAALENRSAHPFGPLYLHQGEALFRIDSLAANGKVELSAATPLEGALNDALKRDLVAGGLTEGEADSFVAAWSPDVLRKPWVWQVFGFYSAEGVEAVVPMTVTPQPKGIVRVMAVTVE